MPVNDVNVPPARAQRADTRWGRFIGYLCGDRYMVGAYPPEWQGHAGPPVSPSAS